MHGQQNIKKKSYCLFIWKH